MVHPRHSALDCQKETNKNLENNSPSNTYELSASLWGVVTEVITRHEVRWKLVTTTPVI